MQFGRDRVNLLAIALLVIAALLFTHLFQARRPSSIGLRYPSSAPQSFGHPIERLIWQGHQTLSRLHQNALHDVNEAAAAYRTKRGRHPPPNFDQWVSFAQSRNSPLNEEFFDQIYEDLGPFWGMQASELRNLSQTYDGSITIRGGKAKFRHIDGKGYNSGWVKLWLKAFEEFEEFLPDLDMALNNVDEPHIIAPWEDIRDKMKIAEASKHTRVSSEQVPIINEFTKYPVLTTEPAGGIMETWDGGGQYWYKARAACHPDSVARSSEANLNMTDAPDFTNIEQTPYIRNFTNARSGCQKPHIHKFHASLIAPGSPQTSTKLFPLFSACKLTGINNDILLPAAKYFDEDIHFSGGDKEAREIPWENKTTVAFWRGSPTGGLSNEMTWRYYQRQRLVSIMNATTIGASEQLYHPSGHAQLTAEAKAILLNQTGNNIPVPTESEYPLAALKTNPTTLGNWISPFMDGKFSTLHCGYQGHCDWMDQFYYEVQGTPLPEMFQYKFLPDADGMSYSGRYHSFLSSSSVPMKATVYSEWHDSRLVPWFHFVPLDVTYRDWYGIIEYFVGYDPEKVDGANGDRSLYRAAHDEDAKAIAYQGLNWAKKALRTDDMIVYMYRLLLEYARICDDNRDRMGWTGDL